MGADIIVASFEGRHQHNRPTDGDLAVGLRHTQCRAPQHDTHTTCLYMRYTMGGASESARPHLHPGIVLLLPFPARPGAPAPGCPRAATALQLQRTDARKSRGRT